MKSKPLIVFLAALVLSDCEKKTAVIPSKFPIIEKTAKDPTHPDYIRKSAVTFEEILSKKKDIQESKLSDAHWEMVQFRDETTIATYLEFLKEVEKSLPEKLPALEIYEAMEAKAGKATIIEYNVGQTVIMMSNSIRNITLYDDATADEEVEKVVKRLTKKYGTSETGKKILEILNTVHSQGLGDRENGIKPWQTPRKPPVYFPRSKKP